MTIEHLEQKRKELHLQLKEIELLLSAAKLKKFESEHGISVGDTIQWKRGRDVKEGIVSKIDTTFSTPYYYAFKITAKGIPSKKDEYAGSKENITVLKKAEK